MPSLQNAHVDGLLYDISDWLEAMQDKYKDMNYFEICNLLKFNTMKVQHMITPLRHQIAKVCHEVNKAYCESIGDMSQPSWEDAPQWQCESALNGVDYHMDNEDTKPSDSHISWLKEKEEAGWIFGVEKNADKKTHPCILPFDELPKEQQTKDFLFKAVVDSFMAEYEDIVRG